MTAKKILILLISSVVLCACGSKTMYSEFKPVKLAGWHEDSVLTYTIQVDDTESNYDVLLCVRHTETYPYQNMWLFCGFGNDELVRDTIEFYLADDRGRWLGNGGNKVIEMPVLYMQNYRFPEAGQYRFTVQQGMRDTELRGVSDVGVIIRQTK